jgi:DNA-binding MarR family transcriptional regulator
MPKTRKMSSPDTLGSSEQSRDDRILRVLMNFRQIMGSAKQHYAVVRRECGLTGAELWALWQIGNAPGLKVTELASKLSIHQSTASNLVDKLGSKSLIRRERRQKDQRVVRLSVTGKGTKLLNRAPAPMRGVLPDAVSGLSNPTLKKLEATLELVLDQIKLLDKRAAKLPLSDIIT